MLKMPFDYAYLWECLVHYATRAGRSTARPLILMYYVLKSNQTPMAEKMLIYSSLAYVLLPIDLISAKRLPVIGWIDEVASLTVAYQKISKHVTPQMESDAEILLNKWFPNYIPYKMVKQ